MFRNNKKRVGFYHLIYQINSRINWGKIDIQTGGGYVITWDNNVYTEKQFEKYYNPVLRLTLAYLKIRDRQSRYNAENQRARAINHKSTPSQDERLYYRHFHLTRLPDLSKLLRQSTNKVARLKNKVEQGWDNLGYKFF